MDGGRNLFIGFFIQRSSAVFETKLPEEVKGRTLVELHFYIGFYLGMVVKIECAHKNLLILITIFST